MKRIKANTTCGDIIYINVHGTKLEIIVFNDKIMLVEDRPNKELMWVAEFQDKYSYIKPKNTLIKIEKWRYK